MSALPPPPPSSPPPGPAPAPKPPVLPPADPQALMPYDDLFGSEERAPELPPNLTFNVAAAPVPPPPPRSTGGPAKPPVAVDEPGIVASDDRPAWVPPRPADEPPDPLLKSPIAAAPPTSVYVQPPAPPAKARSISELMESAGKPDKAEEDTRPSEPQMWSATDAQAGKAAPVVPSAPPPAARPPGPPQPKARSISELMEDVGKPNKSEDAGSPEQKMWSASDALAGKAPPVPKPAAPKPPPPPPPITQLPMQPQSPARTPSFDRIAPAPVRTPPPSAADHRASRPVPLTALTPDDEHDYARAFASDDDDEDTVMMPGGPGGMNSASPEADTVIAVAAPMRRAYGSAPSLRLLGMLMTVLLALWIARLGAAPLFDVDEGAFSEATRELTVGHDWGSTTLNGVDRFDKPILIYWFQAISLKIFGLNEFAVRLPSALSAFLWCLALGHFAWRRFGPAVAIAAAGILATSLGPMLIGRAATADSLLNLLLTIATLDLWRHLENGRDWPRRRAFAWIGLGLLAKGPVALLIPAAAAGLWLVSNRDRSRLVRLINDPVAWLLMAGIALPWYIYAVARHGMAFVNGFLLHHNLERFTGSLEGHAGSLFYYIEILPAAMMPWTPLLVPIAMHLRARWREPLGRFMLLWLGFVVVLFSLSGTKLPHYILYGFTPLMLLAAQELVVVKLPVRLALCVTIIMVVALGAASPWIASSLATSTHDPLYQALLASAPVAPWIWVSVPICLLVFALTIWVPNVRNYLSEADGAVFAALLSAAWMVLAVLPWWGQTVQDPIRTLARTVPIAQMTLLDRQRVVQWRLHQPSIAFYLNQTAPRVDPVNGDWAFTRIDRIKPDELAKLEVVQQLRGYALVRPAPAASEPLSRIGAEQNAAQAASEAAAAQALAVAATKAAQAAADAASAAAAVAAAKLAPAPSAPAPVVPAPVAAPAKKTK
ncbi:MAG: glycosyltransferase family 39 protein [Burkholderiaceae bacterium]|jgi:4-amino-4-deoxy-L-arabinose transferase-like glycosyltransferase